MQSKSIVSILSASALALALSGPVLAAGETGAMGGPQASADPSSMYKADSLMDLSVNDSQGQEIGNIDGVLVDDQGQAHVVVRDQQDTNYLVPWDRVTIDDQQQVASIDIGQDQLSSEFSAFEQMPPTALEQDGGASDPGMMPPPTDPGMGNGATEPPPGGGF